MAPPGLYVHTFHAPTAGPPVVLVHGAPDRSKNFAGVVALLGDLEVTVYDRRGYGRSLEARPPSGGFEDQVADLLAVLDDRPAVVCGQSAGGAIALMAATRAPELFSSVAVWEPPLPWAPWWTDPDGQARLAAWLALPPRQLGEMYNRELIGEARWAALPERTRDLLRAEGAAFHADLASQLTPPFDLADVKCPVVVGAGRASSPWVLEASTALAGRLGAGLLVADGAEHAAHLGQPAVWAELVRRAVARAG